MKTHLTPKDDADKTLASIAKWMKKRETVNQKVIAEIETIRQRHADDIQRADVSITALEKALAKLIKKFEAEIMDGEDRIELPAGSVMLKKEKRVKRIKGMLARLKKARLTVAIKSSQEYVNWDEVEKFNDSRLKRLGTKRVEKKIVSYELRGK